VDAREDVPVLGDFDNLLNTMPYMPPPASMDSQPSLKLKHGWRNVILAIVDQGVVSYLRISDTSFIKEKAYERAARGRGAKGGSRRGGSGRGRGR
jgi:tRNA-splicing endonuclease subunit Sen54